MGSDSSTEVTGISYYPPDKRPFRDQGEQLSYAITNAHDVVLRGMFPSLPLHGGQIVENALSFFGSRDYGCFLLGAYAITKIWALASGIATTVSGNLDLKSAALLAGEWFAMDAIIGLTEFIRSRNNG